MNDATIPASCLAERAERISWALHLIALFAAPVAAKRYGSFPAAEQIMTAMNELLEAGTPQSSLEKLRTLVGAWVPSVDVPVEIQNTARDVLAEMGFPTPDMGWDSWSGLVEDSAPEALTPDPLPPPTNEELAVRPPGYRFGWALEWLKWLASPWMIAKVPPLELFQPAMVHLDALLLCLRPFRSEYASERLRMRSILAELEQLRQQCALWSGLTPTPISIQQAARRILVLLDRETMLDQLMQYDCKLDVWVLQPPKEG
jgi:hypothetical protein